MICPKCGVNDDAVLDSRAILKGFGIRRRRLCVCKHRFTTHESIIETVECPMPNDGIRTLKVSAIKHMLKNIDQFEIDITDNQIIITNKEQENESN